MIFFIPHWCQSWRLNKNLLLSCISGIAGAKTKVIEPVISLGTLCYYSTHPVTQVSRSFKDGACPPRTRNGLQQRLTVLLWKGIMSIRARIGNGKEEQTVFFINKYTQMKVCLISIVNEVSKYFSVYFAFILLLYWSGEPVQANHTTLEGWKIFFFLWAIE